MTIVATYESPDGLLRLLIELTGDDWTIGFAGYAWHTHGDILDWWGYQGTLRERVDAFVRDVTSSKVQICIYRNNGQITDVVVPSWHDHALLEDSSDDRSPNETIEVRFWDVS